MSDTKHTRAVDVVAISGLVVTALWAVANFFSGTAVIAFENIIVAVAFFIALVLNRRGRHDLAPNVVALVFLLHMAFVTFTFGYNSGAHQFFLLGTVIPYLIFPKSASKSANALALLSGLAYLACVLFQKQLPGTSIVGNEASMEIANAVFLLAILASTTAFFVVEMRKADDALEAEYARSEGLLYNLLPESIASRLKKEPDRTIADKLPQVAILFADIVDFTPRASILPPEEVVGFLNRLFSGFDQLAEKHGLEKIKTIGDAYMVAAGIPNSCVNPVHRTAEMALDMLRFANERSLEFPEGLQVRIGLHFGPVVAGVIGKKKLFYDVWGETVNTASRMESHGEPGRIQVTAPVHAELVNDYAFEQRGVVDVKGMEPVETWWLTRKAAHS